MAVCPWCLPQHLRDLPLGSLASAMLPVLQVGWLLIPHPGLWGSLSHHSSPLTACRGVWDPLFFSLGMPLVRGQAGWECPQGHQHWSQNLLTMPVSTHLYRIPALPPLTSSFSTHDCLRHYLNVALPRSHDAPLAIIVCLTHIPFPLYAFSLWCHYHRDCCFLSSPFAENLLLWN